MPLYKIVGSHYYPPAKEILSTLPINTNLILYPEPNNDKDPNAIAIWITGEEILQKTNMKALFNQGDYLIGEAISSRSWHLGYIPADISKTLKLLESKNCTLSFSADGSPMVNLK